MDNLKEGELTEREKKYYSSATMEDMDKVDDLARAIMNKNPSFNRQTASKTALLLFLKANPTKYQSGGKYKKHKSLKRKHSSKKHRKFTNKSKKHKRTRYHRK